jgi:hypothetical protein
MAVARLKSVPDMPRSSSSVPWRAWARLDRSRKLSRYMTMRVGMSRMSILRGRDSLVLVHAGLGCGHGDLYDGLLAARAEKVVVYGLDRRAGGGAASCELRLWKRLTGF